MECNDRKSRARVKERYSRFFLPVCCIRCMRVSFAASVCVVILFGELTKKRRGTSCVVKLLYVVSQKSVALFLLSHLGFIFTLLP
jgi:hypothetical protein